MYPAHSRVGRENLVLRHSVPTFRPVLEALRVEWRNSTSRFERFLGKKELVCLSRAFISAWRYRVEIQSIYSDLQPHDFLKKKT